MTPKLLAVVMVAVLALLPRDGLSQDRVLEPIVRSTIDPPRVVVGQKTTLHIDVLAPNYMTAAPALPTFQLRNAITRELPTVNINEQHDDSTYAGVRFEFAVTPQEEGAYAIAGQQVRIRYAAAPPATREVEVALPKVEFEAFVPDAARGLRPFVSATKLTVEQTIERSSEQLKVGDAVTRKVKISAEGTPAMLLPPQSFAEIDGLKRYPAQPALEDKAVARSGDSIATRVDTATYMLERPGDYALPAIDISWFDVATGKIEVAHADAASFSIAGGSGSGSSPSRSRTLSELIDAAAENWPIALAAIAAAILLAWFAPRAVRALAAAVRRRRTAYLQSETWAFRRLRAARGAETTYSRLLAWLQRFEPIGNDKSIAALTSAAQDPALQREIGRLQEELFSAAPGGSGWSRRALMRHVASVRRALRRPSRSDRVRGLPANINPVGRARPDFSHRRIAR
jgi:hypothetical protein